MCNLLMKHKYKCRRDIIEYFESSWSKAVMSVEIKSLIV